MENKNFFKLFLLEDYLTKISNYSSNIELYTFNHDSFSEVNEKYSKDFARGIYLIRDSIINDEYIIGQVRGKEEFTLIQKEIEKQNSPKIYFFNIVDSTIDDSMINYIESRIISKFGGLIPSEITSRSSMPIDSSKEEYIGSVLGSIIKIINLHDFDFKSNRQLYIEESFKDFEEVEIYETLAIKEFKPVGVLTAEILRYAIDKNDWFTKSELVTHTLSVFEEGMKTKKWKNELSHKQGVSRDLQKLTRRYKIFVPEREFIKTKKVDNEIYFKIINPDLKIIK